MRASLGPILTLVAGLLAAAWSTAIPATDAAPGPLTVEVFELGADGARKARAEVYVHLGGRYATTDDEGRAVFHGLSAGTYPLLVAEPDFERVQRNLTVVPGVREAVAVELRPVAFADWTGRVRLAGTEAPVVGARVALTPVAVATAVHGPARAVTDSEGRLRFMALAPGKYRVEFSAPGVQTLVREVQVGAEALPDVQLERESHPARLDVEVVDSVRGGTVAGAQVTLAEVWPQGLIAQARSDAGGRVVFDGLRVGPLNLLEVGDRVTVARPRVTVRVEAEGHAARVVPAMLTAEGESVRVVLDPLTEQVEVEPNDTLATAQEIRSGAPVRFGIDPLHDRDVFAFRLEQPARVDLRIAAGSSLQMLIRLYDGEGHQLAEHRTQLGQENLIADQVLVAGRYLVEVMEWGSNATSTQPMSLTVEIEPAVDPAEPNDELQTAVALAPQEQASGLIWPRGDRDTYRIEIPRPGVLYIDEPGAPYQRHVRLLKPEGEGTHVVGEWGVHGAQPIDAAIEVGPGTHYLEIREWGDNAVALEPYRLRYAFLPDDELGEADAPPAQSPRRLALPGSAGATLLPSRDRDTYAVEIPGAGVLRVQNLADGQQLLRVLAADGRVLGERGAQRGQSAEVSVDFDGPALVYLALEEWGRDAWSAAAYRLRAWFMPADESDHPVRNDGLATATPVLSGETLTGTYLPRRDVDVHVIDLDLPGYLDVDARSGHQTLLRIHDSAGDVLIERGAQGRSTVRLRPALGPGRYFVSVREWGDDAASAHPYTLSVRHEPVEPDEGWPLADTTPRPLVEGVAQAYAIDQRGDVDRFRFDVAQSATLQISLAGPQQKLLRVFDARDGRQLLERGFQAGARSLAQMEFDSPTPLLLAVREWGDNDASLDPQFIQVDTRARALAAERLTWKADVADPRRGWLQRESVELAQPVDRVEVDLDGDAHPDVRLDDAEPVAVLFPEAGRFVIEAVGMVDGEPRARQRLWADASGPHAREGLFLSLTGISEGQVLDRPVPVSLLATSFNAARIERVEARLNGHLIETTSSPQVELDLHWAGIGREPATLEVLARDSLGAEARLIRRFRLSEYFELSPPDGAVLSAEVPSVSWQGTGFGDARLRYRPQGADDAAWVEREGEAGLVRRVLLPDLEAGVTYEFQPLGGTGPGPVRRLTRVKGLAFGRSQYAANIRRDYDQRISIGVRNNGDQPLSVRLESGQPADPDLLASFVGAGSEDRPFELAPGELREFQFAISAQNVNTEEHRIPIRIRSESGLSDESEILVHVRLPHVELQWADIGPAPNGTGRILRLRNLGDAITDLAVQPAQAHAVVLAPTVRHGLLPRSGHIDFTVTPRFHDGFTGVDTTIQALALDKTFDYAYGMQLAPGEAMHRVWLLPGMDPRDPAAPELEAGIDARVERAQAVDPDALPWRASGRATDTDRDGRPDRWLLVQDDIAWVGTDSDGDGSVDHVHADVGRNGTSEFAAVRVEGRWRPTNLVEAWLEMSFALHGSRDSYKTHDVEVVLNGVTVGLLKDILPEGNFSFRIPPGALRFDESGLPGDNRVGLRTTHLRGGHYVVNSDFRFKFRLTATPVWTVARSPEEARELALAISGVSLTAPDLSLSAAALVTEGPDAPMAGDEMRLRFPVRNLGAAPAHDVVVALMRIQPDGSREEQARITVPVVGLDEMVEADLSWPIRGGLNRLVLVADPDRVFGDPDPANNEAQFMLSAGGDDTPPSLRVTAPADGAVLKDTVVMLHIEVDEEDGPVAPLVSIDGGLWHEVPAMRGRSTVPLLLQPGAHRVEVRAVDDAGNEALVARILRVERALPDAAITAPADGATLAGPGVTVEVAVPDDVRLVAARSAAGPWHKASLLGERAQVELPLRFGAQQLEVMVADRHGALRLLAARVTRTTQPAEGERLSGPSAAEQGLLWPEGHASLEIDLFRTANGVLRVLDIAPEAEAARLWDEARRRQALGDYAGALTLYRDSLMLKPDPQTDERVRKLEAYLGIRRINPGGAP